MRCLQKSKVLKEVQPAIKADSGFSDFGLKWFHPFLLIEVLREMVECHYPYLADE